MENKLCTKCKETKPLQAFNKKVSQSSGYNPQCRDCVNSGRSAQRKMLKEAGVTPCNDQWNKENREYLNTVRTTKRRETRDFIRSLKIGKCCDICGGIFPPVAMDWDHIHPELKSFEICQEGIREMYSQEK